MTYPGNGSEHMRSTYTAARAGSDFIAEKPNLAFIFNVNSDGVLLRFIPEEQTQSVKDLVTVMNEAGGGIDNYSGSDAFKLLQDAAYNQDRSIERKRIKTPASGDQSAKIQHVIEISPVVV